MQPTRVVNVVDEVWQVCRDILEGFIFCRIDCFHFQGFHEALSLRIVIEVTSAAHGSDKAMLLENAPVSGCGILGAPVGMKNAAGQWFSRDDGCTQGSRCETNIDVSAKAIPDDLPLSDVSTCGTDLRI